MIWTIPAALALALLVAIALYNGLVSKRNRCDNAFAGIDVQLKKRHDLVPNLVETVRAYAAHERETIEAAVRARAAAIEEGIGTDEQVRRDNALGQRIGKLIALAEQYPDLEADEQFRFLMRSLNEIEEQLSAARRTFNAAVNAYNDACQMFPSNLVAGVFGFHTRAFFEIVAAERAPIAVDV